MLFSIWLSLVTASSATTLREARAVASDGEVQKEEANLRSGVWPDYGAVNSVYQSVNSGAKSKLAASKTKYSSVLSGGQSKLRGQLQKMNVAQFNNLQAAEEGVVSAENVLDTEKPNVKVAAKAGIADVKINTEALKDLEKDFGKKASTHAKAYSKKIATFEKMAAKYMKQQEGVLSAITKKDASKMKNFVAKDDKNMASMQKTFEKDTEKMESRTDEEFEKTQEAGTEITATAATAEATMESVGESLPGLIDSEAEGQMGLGPAEDKAKTEEEVFYDQMAGQYEELGNTHMLKDEDEMKKIVDKIKDEVGIPVVEKAEEIEQQVGVFAEKGGKRLEKAEGEASLLLNSVTEAQTEEQRKMNGAFQTAKKAEDGVDAVREYAEDQIGNMQAGVNSLIQSYMDFYKGKIDGVEDKMTAELKQGDAAIGTAFGNGLRKVTTTNDIGAAEVTQSFESDMGTANGLLEKEQEVLGNTRQKVVSDTSIVDSTIKAITKVHGKIGDLIKLGTHFEAQKAAIMAEAQKAKNAGIKGVAEMQAKALKQISDKQMAAQADVSKSIVKLQNDITGARGEGMEAFEAIANSMASFNRDMQDQLRPVGANQEACMDQLAKMRSSLEVVAKQMSSAAAGAEGELTQTGAKTKQMEEDEDAYAERQRDEDKSFIANLAMGAEQEVDTSITNAEKGTSTEGAAVRNRIMQAEEEDAGRQSKSVSMQNQYEASWANANNGVDNAESNFPGAYQSRKQQFQDAQSDLRNAVSKGPGERGFFKDGEEARSTKAYDDFGFKTAKSVATLGDSVTGWLQGDAHTLKAGQEEVQKLIEAGILNGDRSNLKAEIAANKLSNGVTDFANYFASSSAGADALAKAKKSGEIMTGARNAQTDLSSYFDRTGTELTNLIGKEVQTELFNRKASIKDTEAGLNQKVADRKTSEEKQTDEYKAMLYKYQQELTGEAREIEAGQSGIRNQFSRENAVIQDEKVAGEAVVNAENSKVTGGQRTETNKLNEQRMADLREQSQADQKAGEVSRNIDKQLSGVNMEVSDMKAASLSALKRIDPSASLLQAIGDLEDLGDLEKTAQQLEVEKSGQVDKHISEMMDRAGNLMKDQAVGARLLAKKVGEASADVQKEFAPLQMMVSNTLDDALVDIKDSTQLSNEIQQTLNNSLNEARLTMHNAKTDANETEDLLKFHGDDVLKDVLANLNIRTEHVGQLTNVKDNVVVPVTDEWRRHVEDVFTQLGASLDMNRIAQVAAMSEANEHAGSAEGGTKKAADDKIAAAQAALSERVRELRLKTQEMIGAVLKQSQLSAAQRAARIAKIQKSADEEANKLTRASKSVQGSQIGEFNEIESGTVLLNGLLDRAEVVVREGGNSKTGTDELLRIQAEIREKADALREKKNDMIMKNDNIKLGSSLLETDGTQTMKQYMQAENSIKASHNAHVKVDADLRGALDLMESHLSNA